MMLIGKRISGRYKIIDIIGGGGMANVYLAHDIILDRDVAVKILRLDFANDEEFIRRFRREAQNATSLAHPNIVNIYDVGEEDSIYYIVMEYVKGKTLKQYIQQHSPVQVETALDIMQQLTSAISHAHQNHIVHRDIKPQNILIDENGTVKITDFGIALALSATSITQTNSVLGSVHYLSPEQARGGMANRKSDIYSLGIVMFELLTGRLPFSGESAVSIALKHLQSVTPSVRRWNPSIPQSVENIVIKATAKDPFHRYESAEEMENDLRTALDPERINEKKLVFPEDTDATKAIPVITEDYSLKDLGDTRVHGKNNPATNKDKETTGGANAGKRKKGPIILISVFITLVMLTILALTVLPGILGPKDIEVPDLYGLAVKHAEKELKDAGFVIGEKIELTNDEVKEGHVIRTDPRAGRMVKEGTTIDIYVSLGKNRFELADYKDRSYSDVFKLLADKNFKDIRKNEVFHDSDPGTIIEQSIPAGEKVVPEDTIIEFTVSKGPEVIKLRDLTGYNQKALNDYADETGLVIDVIEERYSETVDKGLVISQEPEAGTELHKGDKVEVILSKGKSNLPFKPYPYEFIIPYEPSEEGKEQVVQIYIGNVNRDIDELAEEFKIRKNTTKKVEFLIAPDSSAYLRVVRDGKVIREEKFNYSVN